MRFSTIRVLEVLNPRNRCLDKPFPSCSRIRKNAEGSKATRILANAATAGNCPKSDGRQCDIGGARHRATEEPAVFSLPSEPAFQNAVDEAPNATQECVAHSLLSGEPAFQSAVDEASKATANEPVAREENGGLVNSAQNSMAAGGQRRRGYSCFAVTKDRRSSGGAPKPMAEDHQLPGRQTIRTAGPVKFNSL